MILARQPMHSVTEQPVPQLRREEPGEFLAYYALLPLTWLRQFFSNSHGILRVFDITRFRPLPAGLIDEQHPWVTGVNPHSGQFIWLENVLYRSRRDPGLHDAPPDDVIVRRVGRFLADFAGRSATRPEIPWGLKRRMPHAINYIHGAIHYASGILIFNDFTDGYRHFSDLRFRREICRFACREQREVLLIFRQQHYTGRQYAYFTGFLRSLLPWFCNSNGPQKRVLWGNPAPYAVVNIIAGHWMTDVYRLKREGSVAVLRPPIPAGKYFQGGAYLGTRECARWPEKLLAHLTYLRIRLRGSKGGLFFVDRRQLLAAKLARMAREGVADEPVAHI